MEPIIQQPLGNERAILLPLKDGDFDALYAVASDPGIWEQHPNKDRWKKEVFQNFFEGAMQSGGAFRIIEKITGKTAGSTRYYDYDSNSDRILIGYTFYAREFWGTGLNLSVKAMMLDHIFRFVSEVRFHIGATNTRSQVAIGRLGARKTGEEEIAYFGEASKLNFEYSIRKDEWMV